MSLALLPAAMRDLVEPGLGSWIEPLWWEEDAQLVALAPRAEIGWFDQFEKAGPLAAVQRATGLRWLCTAFAGVDWLPLADLAARGVRLSCGSGLNANAVAEFAVMAMLAEARGFADLVRAQDRREWLRWPGRMFELAGSRALVMGYGAIGSGIGRMLAGFGVRVTAMRRTGAKPDEPGREAGAPHEAPGQAPQEVLGPDQWRARLGEFDWVVLALPGTPATRGLIDAAALAAMHPRARLINVGRADTIDQGALAAALHGGRLAGAILDLTDPEPLPPSHPLWDCPNLRITMHTAGLPTPAIRRASAQRFLENCARYHHGAPLVGEVDLLQGY